MASNVGSQSLSVKYHDPVNSDIVNSRFYKIRPAGIYQGGQVLVPGTGNNVTVQRLIAEVRDVNGLANQVRVVTGEEVTVAVAEATPYVVLRWTHTENEATDYVEFIAVATPGQHDVIIAKITFTAGTATGRSYTEQTFANNNGNFCKVVPTYLNAQTARVTVNPGVVRTAAGYAQVTLQNVNLAAYSSGASSYVYIYLTAAGAIGTSATLAGCTGQSLLARVLKDGNVIDEDHILDLRSFLQTQGGAQSIEVRTSDPSGADLYDGRIWLLDGSDSSQNAMLNDFKVYDYNTYDAYQRHDSNASWFDYSGAAGTITPPLLKLFDGHTPIGVGNTRSTITTSPRTTEDFAWIWGNGNAFRLNEYFESEIFAYPIDVSSIILQAACWGWLTRGIIEYQLYLSATASWTAKQQLVSFPNLATNTAQPIQQYTSTFSRSAVTRFRLYFAFTGVGNYGPRCILDNITIMGAASLDLRIRSNSSTFRLLGARV